MLRGLAFLSLLALSLPCWISVQAQNCPLIIRKADPLAPAPKSSPAPAGPLLRVAYTNKTAAPVVKATFKVHFPGAYGEFTATHLVAPKTGDAFQWSDAAFIGTETRISDIRVVIERVVFQDGTVWLDDGSESCTFTPSKEHEPGLAAGVQQSAAAAGKQIATAEATSGPLDRFRAAVLSLRTAAVSIETAYPGIGNLAFEPVEKFPVPSRFLWPCPVMPEYVDLGSEGRLYSGLRNLSSLKVASVDFSVRQDESVRIVKQASPIAPGEVANAASVMTPALNPALATIVFVNSIRFEDGEVWKDAGQRECAAILQARETTPVPPAALAESAQSSNPATPATLQQTVPPPANMAGTAQGGSTAALPVPAGSTPSQIEPLPAGPEHSDADKAPIESLIGPEAVHRYAGQIRSRKASICSVASTPEGASVELDGEHLGATPLVFVLLRKKDRGREVRVTSPGYEPVLYELFPDGRNFPLVIKMNKASEDPAQ